MPKPRSHLISIETTPYYHITTRCVRRAFLCGLDHHTGQSFEHRRQWIEDRIRLLSSIFSIQICAYAVMSNHYHLVVKLNPNEAKTWSDKEVLQRWRSLFKGPLLIQRFAKGDALTAIELDTVKSTLAIYRKRLASLSWMMKCLNEGIARKANAEDHCTGHFWEARFTSQALLSDQALLTCMAYVDLNPIRAQMAKTLKRSHYTSLKERLVQKWQPRRAIQEQLKTAQLQQFHLPVRPLMAFSNENVSIVKGNNHTLPITFDDYVQLVDYNGRAIRYDKRGAISSDVPPVVMQPGITKNSWIDNRKSTKPSSTKSKFESDSKS